VGRNAPISHFGARGHWGVVKRLWRGDSDCHQQHCLLLMLTFPFRLRRLVRTGFSRSLKFQGGERPKTRLRLRSFPVLEISGPDPVQSWFFCSPKTGLTSTIHMRTTIGNTENQAGDSSEGCNKEEGQ